MKLGEGGEAFFVFETYSAIPSALQTSPVASPAASPEQRPFDAPTSDAPELDLEPLDLEGTSSTRRGRLSMSMPPPDPLARVLERPQSGDWSGVQLPRSHTDDIVPTTSSLAAESPPHGPGPLQISKEEATAWNRNLSRSTSPPPVSPSEAKARAIRLSKKLLVSDIPNVVTDRGDLRLDMTGYKSGEEEALRAEVVARKILADELEGNYDIGALIGADEQGALWIYSSEEAKVAASRKTALNLFGEDALRSSDAISDPGYHSDDGRSDTTEYARPLVRRDSDSAVELSTPPQSPDATAETRNYAKTLRLTSDQLKALDLKPGSNTMSFKVGNRSVCTAYIFYWRHDTPIVISDIDGTITKSDALGHVFTYIGRDWTHPGVAKLYTDIVNNGYNIFYLTSRSVGQADMTRNYLNGVAQDGYRLPKGPVIMSPDRTVTALHREVYLRKPEVFKMSCLRDIKDLFGKPSGQTPFYAGFGNRFSDALSYRSVNIPSTRIFTIDSAARVKMDVLSLSAYDGYASMREIVDHFFPPVGLLVAPGGEQYTDYNYWRDKPLDIEDFTDSEDEGDDQTEAGSLRSEDEGSEIGEDLAESYISRDSIDETSVLDESILESVEGDDYEDESGEEEDVDEEDDGDDDDEIGELEELTPTHETDGNIDPLVQEVNHLHLTGDNSTLR